jgi:peptidoglycan hydrolase-like protein with peptidoglycan-binding domain
LGARRNHVAVLGVFPVTTPRLEDCLVSRTPFAVGAVALALLAAGCNSGPETAASPETVAQPTAQLTDKATRPAPVAPTTAAPKPTVTAKPKPSYDVVGIQKLLTAQKMYIGPIDGKPGNGFVSAVAAFQKVNGLYGDGVVGKKTLAALQHPASLPKLKGTGSGSRVEVDLTKQLLYVVKDNVITRILPVSSGSGKKYLTKKGHLATALTPIGHYVVQRRIPGVRVADLGTLYDPQYYYKGWAIHGSGSVPGYPASHGCIRVSRANGTWLLGQINVGTHIWIYGGTHVFTAGSKAPGTDDPGGDTGTEPTASPTPAASPSATPQATATPKATPSPTKKP